MKNEGEEIRRRFPRIVMNSIMAIIFWAISVYVPPTLKSITIPGIGTDASLLMWILTILILGIFLVRVLSDALVLGDILTDVFVRRLGVKEERSPKRAARELVYIIIIVLVVTAISPLLSTVQDYGYYFTVAATYIGLGLIIVFIYDIGRIIYKIIEEKAESVANHLAEVVQKNKNSG
jgi:cation transport ATPase